MSMQGSEELFIEIVERLGLGSEAFESRSREGVFTPALTMWLMMCQRIKGGKGLLEVIEDLIAGEGQRVRERNVKSKRLKVTKISLNTSGYSQARSRLSVETVRKITAAICEAIVDGSAASWHGKKVYLCDGTTFDLYASKKNLRDYKPIKNQHGTAHTPAMQCLFCHELMRGTALNVQFAPYRGPKSSSEQELCLKVMDALPSNSLLIADRNFGIFTIAYEAMRRKTEVLVRLTETRAKHLAGAAIKNTEVDIPVNWEFKGTTIESLDIPEDAQIQGRFIKHTLKRKGFKNLTLYFFTTSPEAVVDLVELYAQREKIENDIRSLKYVLGMDLLSGKTPDMIEKELLLGVSAYNLTRAVVAKAAKKLGIPPRKISFSRAVRLTRLFGNQLSSTNDKLKQKQIIESFIIGLNQSKLPERAYFRIEPRKIARERSSYPRLRASRAEERCTARKILKQFGHRNYFTTISRKY